MKISDFSKEVFDLFDLIVVTLAQTGEGCVNNKRKSVNIYEFKY